MTKLKFLTGNKHKFYEGSKVCSEFGIELEQAVADIDEIQHHDPIKITIQKVKSAYDALQCPVVVSDHSWEIPALGGFPGGYMKDMNGWLKSEDFLLLMKDKQDKRVFLHEVVAYYDGDTLKTFEHTRPGHFLDEPHGVSGPSFARVVEIEGDGMSISEVFGKGNWETKEEHQKAWYDFAKWFKNK